MGDHQNKQPLIVAPNPDDQLLKESMEPTNLFAMLRLNSFKTSTSISAAATTIEVYKHHTPCTTYGYSGLTNSMKHQSPSSCSSLQDPSMAVIEVKSEPRAKKLFFEKEELTDHGFSLISLPISLGTLANENPCHVLHCCSSDACNPPSAATGGDFLVTPFHSSKHAKMAANPVTPSSVSGSSLALSLPHQPPSLN